MELDLDVAERIVSSTLVNDGAWLHLHRPNDVAALVYADKDNKYPARLKVRSHRHPDFQNHLFTEAARQQEQRKSRSKPTPAVVREVMEAGKAANFARLVMAVENLSSKKLGEEIRPSIEDLEALAALPAYQWMVEQVNTFAWNDANFGVPAEATPGND